MEALGLSMRSRFSLVKASAAANAARIKPAEKRVASLLRVNSVHKAIVQLLPHRYITSTKITPPKKPLAVMLSARLVVKPKRFGTLRSLIKPRVASKKLAMIKPVKKHHGRHLELTGRRLRALMGHNTLMRPMPSEFRGVSYRANPTAVFSGEKTMTSVPVDRPLVELQRTLQLYVSGIPGWLEPATVYYDLLVALAKHHLELVTLSVTSHADEGQVAWAKVKLSHEAETLMESMDFQLELSPHEVFSIPASIKLSPAEVLVAMVFDI